MRLRVGKCATLGLVGFLASLLVASALAGCGAAGTSPSASQAASHPVAQAAASALVAGTVLDSSAAPAFSLRDQNGATIALEAVQGHPVVLTFLDATCTTECPITAQYLNWTAQALGPKASAITWLAISVNPSNTPQQAQAFITKNHVVVPLHVLLGTQQTLAAVWHAYHIAVIPPPTAGGDVQHTVVTYLLDAHGHEREVLDQVFDPQQAAHDLRTLLAAS